jgi:hypothetical protein
MTYEMGDIVEFDFGKEYMILKGCQIDEYEYYFSKEENSATEFIVFKKLKDNDEIIILQEEEEIEKALKNMI